MAERRNYRFNCTLFIKDYDKKADGRPLREMAKEIGLSHMSLWRYLNYKAVPDIPTYFRICDYMGCSTERYVKIIRD